MKWKLRNCEIKKVYYIRKVIRLRFIIQSYHC